MTSAAFLGEWLTIEGLVMISVTAQDGGPATARAVVRLPDLVEVVDLNGQHVPVTRICAESGTEY